LSDKMEGSQLSQITLVLTL